MQPHQATAITLTACQVLKVSRSSFLSILKESDEDFEKFCMIRDNINLYGLRNFKEPNCKNCQRVGHGELTCPRLHFIPDREKIILRQNFSTIHKKRAKMLRKEIYPHNSLADLSEIQDDQDNFIQMLGEMEIDKYITRYYKQQIVLVTDSAQPEDNMTTSILANKQFIKQNTAQTVHLTIEELDEDQEIENPFDTDRNRGNQKTNPNLNKFLANNKNVELNKIGGLLRQSFPDEQTPPRMADGSNQTINLRSSAEKLSFHQPNTLQQQERNQVQTINLRTSGEKLSFHQPNTLQQQERNQIRKATKFIQRIGKNQKTIKIQHLSQKPSIFSILEENLKKLQSKPNENIAEQLPQPQQNAPSSANLNGNLLVPQKRRCSIANQFNYNGLQIQQLQQLVENQSKAISNQNDIKLEMTRAEELKNEVRIIFPSNNTDQLKKMKAYFPLNNYIAVLEELLKQKAMNGVMRRPQEYHIYYRPINAMQITKNIDLQSKRVRKSILEQIFQRKRDTIDLKSHRMLSQPEKKSISSNASFIKSLLQEYQEKGKFSQQLLQI